MTLIIQYFILFSFTSCLYLISLLICYSLINANAHSICYIDSGICEIIIVAHEVTRDMLSTKAGPNFMQDLVGVSSSNDQLSVTKCT